MDTTGQDKFNSLGAIFYRSAYGALLVFDLTDQESFDKLEWWHDQIKNNAEKNCVMIIVGNKCDLEEDRIISHETATKFA